MAGLNPNISIITLNVNNLYIPSKKEIGRVYKKKVPTYMLSERNI